MATKEIPLTKGFVTIVDEADYDWLNQWKWLCNIDGYASRSLFLGGKGNQKKYKTIRMHRLIVDATTDQHVDHVNGNRLDNRRRNLRICTPAQNQFNSHPRGGTSKYKGVYWQTAAQKWHAQISFKKKYHLGYFDSEDAAALAYNDAAKKYFGEFALLNVVDM